MRAPVLRALFEECHARWLNRARNICAKNMQRRDWSRYNVLWMYNTEQAFDMRDASVYFLPPVAVCPYPAFLQNMSQIGQACYRYYIPTPAELKASNENVAITLWTAHVHEKSTRAIHHDL